MSIRSDLRKYLSEQDTVIAAVNSRVYPVARPQDGELPCLTYARLTGGHSHNLQRATGSSIPTFEIDCLAGTYEAADALAEIVRQKMQGFGPGAFGTTAVKSVILDDEQDSIEVPEDGSDAPIYHITLQYRIQYSESVPTP